MCVSVSVCVLDWIFDVYMKQHHRRAVHRSSLWSLIKLWKHPKTRLESRSKPTDNQYTTCEKCERTRKNRHRNRKIETEREREHICSWDWSKFIRIVEVKWERKRITNKINRMQPHIFKNVYIQTHYTEARFNISSRFIVCMCEFVSLLLFISFLSFFLSSFLVKC